jgi:HEPN domain-containing protein
MDDGQRADQLLQVARKDRNTLEAMIAAEVAGTSHFDPAIFGFHAQQAVEKTLKSWLVSLGQTYPFTHDLQLLLDQLADAGQDPQPFAALADLTPFAVFYRYELMTDDLPPIDRSDYLSRVDRLLTHVEQSLNKPPDTER